MTTIAYNHKDKEIAFDSRTSRENLIISDCSRKDQEIDGVIFIQSGPISDFKFILDAYFGVKFEGAPCTNCAFIVDKGVAYKAAFDPDEGFWVQELKCNDVSGSGGNFALAAMDFGCNAKEAVKYAKKRDTMTGGKVRVVKVE